jgi:hypothetical protein
MERVDVTAYVGLSGRGSGRVESALVRLSGVSSSELAAELDTGLDTGLDIAANLSKWNERFEAQRTRLSRRLSLIDARLGLGESHPVLTVVGGG